MPEASRNLFTRLSIVLGIPFLLSATAIASARLFESGDPRRPGPPADIGERMAPDPNVLRIAGSGSALPLVRGLADALTKRETGIRIVVHPSIGTRGGVHATADGVVEIGVASRPLKPQELRLGIVAIPLARTAVVLAAHPSVPDRQIDHGRLRELILGRTIRWQSGRRAIFLARERGDSSTSVLDMHLPAIADALTQAAVGKRWRVLHHDADLEEALRATPHAAGFHDLGAVRIQSLPVHIVKIDGLDPESPSYPHLKELFLLTRGRPRGLADRFIAFARSDEGRAIAERAGYVP